LTGELSQLYTIPSLRNNVLVLMSLLSISVFCSFLQVFQLKNLKGSLVQNTLICFTTQFFANASGGVVQSYFGTKNAFTISYLIGCVGATALLLNWDNARIFPVLIITSVFGVSASFNLCFIANSELIPTLLSASVFGYCNVIARLFGVFAPQAAELDFPTPEVMLIVFTIVAAILAQRIDTNSPKYI